MPSSAISVGLFKMQSSCWSRWTVALLWETIHGVMDKVICG